MEIKIGNRIESEIHKNYYKLVICFMHGDGDADTEEIYHINKDNIILLENLINFLNELNKNNDSSWEDSKYYDNSIEFIHPSDCTANYEFLANYSGYIVTYFDENGDEFEVNIST